MDLLDLKKDERGKQKKIRNWGEYNDGLVERGSLQVYLTEEVIHSWYVPSPKKKKQGGQLMYSDACITFMYELRQVYKLCLRRCEGFVRSILLGFGIAVSSPDYTTICKRFKKLNLKVTRFTKAEKADIPSSDKILLIDSTGIKVVGEKEWINYKHKAKLIRSWRKLHIGIDSDGMILCGSITSLRQSDIKEVPNLLDQLKDKVNCIIGDGAYSTKCVEDFANILEKTNGARAIGPPKKGEKIDPLYKLRLLVESTISRYKRIIGNKFKARNITSQENEAILSLNILNRMLILAKPKY